MSDRDKHARACAIWQYGEPVHAIVYYAPERRAATDALGLRGGWMSYFACRAAPLGAATASVVTALFYNFHPRMVARAIPDAWSYASPSALLDARLASMDGAMRRVLGEDIASSSSVSRAADLAAAAVAGCNMTGRPMGAANQAVPEPDEPHLRLWQALTAMRDTAATVTSTGWSTPASRPRKRSYSRRRREGRPRTAFVPTAAGRPKSGRQRRGHWRRGGWSTARPRITPAGAKLRQAIEDGTDRLAAPIAAVIGDGGVDELVTLLRPLAEAVMSTGAVPASNNDGRPLATRIADPRHGCAAMSRTNEPQRPDSHP